MPYIGMVSPDNSILSVSVYDTKSDVITHEGSINKEEIEDYFDIIRRTTDVKINVEERVFREYCIDWIYNFIHAIANNTDMDCKRIHEFGIGWSVYIPYIKATYKVGHPYKLIERKTEKGTIIMIYEDTVPITEATLILDKDDYPKKFIPLREGKQLDKYNYLMERISEDDKYIPSIYPITTNTLTVGKCDLGGYIKPDDVIEIYIDHMLNEKCSKKMKE